MVNSSSSELLSTRNEDNICPKKVSAVIALTDILLPTIFQKRLLWGGGNHMNSILFTILLKNFATVRRAL